MKQEASRELKMEATCPFKTLVDFQQTTQQCIPQDRTLHNHKHENIESYRPRFFSETISVSHGHVTCQWISVVSHMLTDYKQFRAAFRHILWSESTQNLVKCSIYLNKQSGLPLSGHFSKYTVLVFYLD
jgi:hypothetical protein